LNLKRKKERVISDPSKWDLDNRDIDVKKLSKEELMKYILPKEVLA
jgi:TolB-like protein